MPREDVVDALRNALKQHVREKTFASEDARTITYGELVEKSNVSVLPRGLGPFLSRLGQRCNDTREPRLDALVVAKRTKKPGGHWPEDEWQAELKRCYLHKPYTS